MKRFILPLLILIFMLLPLSSCQSKAEVYTMTKNGENFVVDTVNKTIENDGNIYKYSINGNTINITYPNSATFWWTSRDNGQFTSGMGGWSDNYNEAVKKYVDGDTLVEILSLEAPSLQKPSFKAQKILLIVLLLALGIWNAIFPRSAWYFSHGWKYKNIEPSDLSLLFNRISGIIFIIAGISLLLL